MADPLKMVCNSVAGATLCVCNNENLCNGAAALMSGAVALLAAALALLAQNV